MADARSNKPLISGVSPYQVDFVVPKLGIDLPLGIDPFLLFKSRDAQFKTLHDSILRAFNFGFELIRHGEYDKATNLLTFPEVAQLGLGYTTKGKRGTGVGPILSDLIVRTVASAPKLLARGLRHIEELQLVS